jgi:cell division transport system permease protein
MTEAPRKTGNDGSTAAGKAATVAAKAAPTTATQPDSVASTLKQDMPLVPASSIAGRALITVIAIMTYLAALAAGAAFLIAGASEGWRSSISREMTVQVRPAPGRDLEADAGKAAEIARSAPGVAEVRVFSKAESEHLLEPWLGAGLDLGELPVPRMIVVRNKAGETIDTAALRKALAEKLSTATLDDHRQWISRLATMANTIVLAATVIFLLVVTAMTMAVTFATRGAMVGNREIVDVLHFVGAEDRFIARQFQRHFLRLGLRGGLAGSLAAIVTFMGFGLATAWWLASPGGDQMEMMFGSFSLGLWGYVAILAIGVAIAFLTGTISRLIVYRRLGGME